MIGRLSATFGGALTSGPAAVASPAYAINVIVRGPDNVFTTRSCCLDGRLNEFCASDAEDFGISETTTKGLITSAVPAIVIYDCNCLINDDFSARSF